MTKLSCPCCSWVINEDNPKKYLGKSFECPECNNLLVVTEQNDDFILEKRDFIVCKSCGSNILIPVNDCKIVCNCGCINAIFPDVLKER